MKRSRTTSTTQLNVEVPVSLHQLLKIEALKRGRKMNEFVIDGLVAYLVVLGVKKPRRTNGHAQEPV